MAKDNITDGSELIAAKLCCLATDVESIVIGKVPAQQLEP